MSQHHLVRVGALGAVGRFTAVDAVRYPRHARVVLRTARGLEIGEVLTPPPNQGERGHGDGSILRRMTVEDELLEARLEKNRQAAYAACVERLAELKLDATLMDVEHLFDGRTLLFYFLGEITPELEAVTSQLTEAYDSRAQLRRFGELVAEGCGPGCGTESAAGCKTCVAGCPVSAACAKPH